MGDSGDSECCASTDDRGRERWGPSDWPSTCRRYGVPVRTEDQERGDRYFKFKYLVENKCPAREYSTVQHYGDLLIVELVRPDCRLVLRLKGLKRLIRQFTVLVRPRNGAETFYR